MTNPLSGKGGAVAPLFRPNHTICQTTLIGLCITWAFALITIWTIRTNGGVLPSPLETLLAVPDLWFEKGLGVHLFTSITLNLQAVAIMSTFSLLVSYMTVVPAFRPLAIFLSAGRFNGFVGIPLIFTMIIGDSHWVKVALLVFGMSVFTIPAVVKVIEIIPKEDFNHARTLRMHEWRVVWEVVVLGRFDDVIDILRTNVAMGWMMLPMVEGLFKDEGGIGTLILVENKYLHLAPVYAIMIIIGFIGLLQDGTISVIKKIICKYAFLGLER